MGGVGTQRNQTNKKDRDSIPDIVFQGEVIKNVSSHKHLGVFISSDLNGTIILNIVVNVLLKS